MLRNWEKVPKFLIFGKVSRWRSLEPSIAEQTREIVNIFLFILTYFETKIYLLEGTFSKIFLHQNAKSAKDRLNI